MYVRLKSKEKKECEYTSGKLTYVMELVFTSGGESLRVLIKDLIDGDDKHIINQARIKAKEYFRNKEEGNDKK